MPAGLSISVGAVSLLNSVCSSLGLALSVRYRFYLRLKMLLPALLTTLILSLFAVIFVLLCVDESFEVRARLRIFCGMLVVLALCILGLVLLS